MQVFNSFQEMAAGTGALGAQGTMSVFNAGEFGTSTGNPERDANIDKIRTELNRLLDKRSGEGDRPHPDLDQQIRDFANFLFGLLQTIERLNREGQ